MRKLKLAKLTLNIGAGTDQKALEKGIKLLKHITGIDPIKTFATKRIPGWGLRPGLPIGCKLTIRGKKAEELVGRLVQAKDSRLKKSSFDDNGNISFGIHEYIDIPEVKYAPEIGITGLQVCVTLERPGYRIKKRKIGKSKIPRSHKVTKDDAMDFMKNTYKVEVDS